jgi:hypothetical protein
MDFIERVFHLSPDHGDGSFEDMLVFAFLLLAAFAIRSFLRRTRLRKQMLLDPSFRASSRPPGAKPTRVTRTG